MPEDDPLPVSGAEIGLIARGASAVRKALRKPDKVRVLRYRESLRAKIRENLRWPDRDHSPEVIVVRLSKADRYPSTDDWRFGLFRSSPWFKHEVKQITDRDLEVFIAIEYVTISGKRARRSFDTKDARRRKVYVVGRIPLERISHIDWEPDSAYGLARFYVSYGWKGPYRELALFEGSTSASLYEIHDVQYQGEGGNLWRWLKWTGSRLQFQLGDRRQRKKDFKELAAESSENAQEPDAPRPAPTRPVPGGAGPGIEVYKDEAGHYRWRATAANGLTMASSVEPFASDANARRAASHVRLGAKTFRYDTYADTAGNYRWRAQASNNQIVASSARSFSSLSAAKRAAELFRDNGTSATGPVD